MHQNEVAHAHRLRVGLSNLFSAPWLTFQVIVADNVITPGAPDFLAYVRAASHYRTRFVAGHIEYTTDVPDGIEICECVADPPGAPRLA
jgi:hypothetical protein